MCGIGGGGRDDTFFHFLSYFLSLTGRGRLMEALRYLYFMGYAASSSDIFLLNPFTKDQIK